MVNEIYLLRHGLVNSNGDLSEEGLKLSEDLPKLLTIRYIDFILSDEEQRCKDTVSQLIKSRDLKVKYCDKEYFKSNQILKDFNSYSTLLICYRYESIGEIQHELGIKLLSDYTRNQFYEYIFHLRYDKDKWHLMEAIPTGYKK